MKNKEKILIIGACGQIGRELTIALRERYGLVSVTASDRIEPKDAMLYNYVQLNVLDKAGLLYLVRKENFTQIYLLAAILSARGEQAPLQSWELNMDGLLNVLDIAVKCNIKQVFWPSSIAVFGPNNPKEDCPQDTPLVPETVYGMSKVAGELWCKYYYQKHGLDIRSIRYPGLISHKAMPGGGTTDYAVDIFHHALQNKNYTCFLNEESKLPMMYMDDAIRATIDLMEAPIQNIETRTSYNLSAFSFTPREIAEEIKKHIPDFQITYNPDFRQEIADSWPASINDKEARREWGWRSKFTISSMVSEMIKNLKYKYYVEMATEEA